MSAIALQSESVPSTFGTIERPRLLKELRYSAEKKLTLLSAPPGYGKTILSAQFANQAPYPVAWHTLTEHQRDLPNLYEKACAVLELVAPGIQSLPSAVGYQPNELAALMAHYLDDHLQEPVIYILDDVHVLAGSPRAEEWLRRFIELAPPDLHIILNTRCVPDVDLNDMISRRQVQFIGQQHLRMTPDETHRLAETLLGTAPTQEDVETLVARLEGWPAGTVLALQPLPHDIRQAVWGGAGGPEALFNSFATAMLDALPSRLATFLLDSSTLSMMTPIACNEVLGLRDSHELLQTVQERNLFLSRTKGGLVYHSLFRDFLQRELKRRDPGRFLQLHLNAARWFKGQDEGERSFEHYMLAERTQDAADLADRLATEYFVQGKLETLLQWGDQLLSQGVKVPEVFYRCAIINGDRYQYELAETYLKLAEDGYAAKNQSEGVTKAQLQQAFINSSQGQFEDAARQAEQLLDRIQSNSLRGQALRILGHAQVHGGKIDTAIQHLEEAANLLRAEGDSYYLTNVLMTLELAYLRQGRLDDVAASMREVVALRRAMGAPGALASALNNLGYHYHLRGNYEQAQAALEEGWDVASSVSDRRAQSYLLWSLGDLQRDRGMFTEASSSYSKALDQLGQGHPYAHANILISMSTLRRWEGDPEQAVSIAERACGIAAAGFALEQLTARAALWASRSATGDVEQAQQELKNVAHSLRENSNNLELAWVQGLRACNALQASDPEAAHEHLDAALEVMRKAVISQLLIAELVHTPELAAFVERYPIRYERFLRDMEKLRHAQVAFEETPPHHTIAVREPYRLEVHALGQELVKLDGISIPPTGWRTAAARDLLFTLFFVGPKSRDEIGLLLWPDATADQVRSNVNTCIYYCRTRLGANTICRENGTYLLNPDVDTWSDVHEMEESARLARLLPVRDVRTEDLWRRAVKLYQGDFLPSLDAEWANTRRIALQDLYIEALTGLGRCANARRDNVAGLKAFEQALTVDPYREDIHQHIMRTYAAQNDKGRLISHYDSMKRLFHDDLGIEVSNDTAFLMQTLTV